LVSLEQDINLAAGPRRILYGLELVALYASSHSFCGDAKDL